MERVCVEGAGGRAKAVAEIAVWTFGVAAWNGLPVDGCVLPVDGCVLPVDGCVLPVDGCVLPVDGCVNEASFLQHQSGHSIT